MDTHKDTHKMDTEISITYQGKNYQQPIIWFFDAFLMHNTCGSFSRVTAMFEHRNGSLGQSM